MGPLLQVEHLSISFTQYDRGTRQRSLPVIRDLSFAIRPGQVVAVVGSSGSGKSLLAHGILGILPYNSHVKGASATRARRLPNSGQRPSGAGRSPWCPRASPI